MKKTISLNIAASLLLQVVTILSGLIVPRLILGTFGSTVNGLISSINQFLNYIALLEGGVASVMMANMYKPLYNHDNEKLSGVIKTVKLFFRNISFVFVAYLLVVAVGYPFLVKNDLGWLYISTLTVILGINLFSQYCFAYTYKLLLNADNKVYVTALTSTFVIILNTIFVYIGIKTFPNIHVVKLITTIVFILQPLVYYIYVKKHYKLDKYAVPDKTAIKQRWDGFGINLAAFVHNNTDVVILSIFSTLPMVSVYAVYLLVINGIKSLIISMMNGIVPTLGKKIAKGELEELKDFFEKYEFFCFFITSIAFSIGAILIVPFVRLYTLGITDANYTQPVFASILLIAEFCYCVRDPYVSMAYQSGVFREISKYAYIEAILNIVISIILVKKIGIVGVAIGTLISMAYRTLMQVYYLKDHLIYRKPSIFIRYFLAMCFTGTISYILLSNIYNANLLFIGNPFLSFGLLLFASVVINILLFVIVAYCFFNKQFKVFLKTGW